MDQEDVIRALAVADAAYEPFAPFSEWVAEPIGLGTWDDAASHLAAVRAETAVADVTAALDEVLRAAAVDTGAIEGLYRADRGFTMSVARNVISLDQAEVEAGLGFRRSFEAQLAGFELVVDLATRAEVLTEAAIREIHNVTCADDATYRVLTPHGVQERVLVLGAYKTDPNHVQLADGTYHSYAPVDRVGEEVHRLVAETRTEAFLGAPAVVQAAFVHHAFTSIHPFSDGNGRVARLLASVWLLRSASIPLWVEVSDRDAYIEALGAADRGDRQPLLRLVTSLTLRLMRELTEQLPPTAPQVGRDERAARRAIEVANEIAEELIRGVEGAKVQYPLGGLSLALRRGMVQPASEQVVAISATSDLVHGYALATDIDPDADELGRIVLYTLDRPLDSRPATEHRFEVDDLEPVARPATRRRIERMVRRLFEDNLERARWRALEEEE